MSEIARPDQWFERAIHAISSSLSLRPGLDVMGRSGFWLIEKKDSGPERWVMWIDRCKQDSMTIRAIRGCNTWEPTHLQEYRRSLERDRDEHLAPARIADRETRAMLHEAADSNRVRVFQGKSAPHNPEGYRRGLLKEALKQTDVGQEIDISRL